MILLIVLLWVCVSCSIVLMLLVLSWIFIIISVELGCYSLSLTLVQKLSNSSILLVISLILSSLVIISLAKLLILLIIKTIWFTCWRNKLNVLLELVLLLCCKGATDGTGRCFIHFVSDACIFRCAHQSGHFWQWNIFVTSRPSHHVDWCVVLNDVKRNARLL